MSFEPPPADASARDLCAFLPWDSQFFGCRIARMRPSRITAAEVAQVLTWCRQQRIDCLYFLADLNDQTSVHLARTHGFQLVDLRVTLERTPPAAPPSAPAGLVVRTARDQDIPVLRRIAAASHHDTRFYADGHFTPARCGALYETWIEQACHEPTGRVYVADVEDQPMGYVAVTGQPGSEGKIGLIAVSAAAQGRGAGAALVARALGWLAEQKVSRVAVVTQGRNARALRLYERHGFVTRSIELWYHCWFTENAS